MKGQGNYVIVGQPFDSKWIVWGGGLDKWGPFGEEMRFSTPQGAEDFLTDARKDAQHQKLGLDRAVYVARAKPGYWTGSVFNFGVEVKVDFTDNDLTPCQMRELGVL